MSETSINRTLHMRKPEAQTPRIQRPEHLRPPIKLICLVEGLFVSFILFRQGLSV